VVPSKAVRTAVWLPGASYACVMRLITLGAKVGYEVLPLREKIVLTAVVGAIFVATPDLVYCESGGSGLPEAMAPNPAVERFTDSGGNEVELHLHGFVEEVPDPNPQRPSHVRGHGMARIERESGLTVEDVKQIMRTGSMDWSDTHVAVYCGTVAAGRFGVFVYDQKLVMTAYRTPFC
jgi:hypothetical protein